MATLRPLPAVAFRVVSRPEPGCTDERRPLRLHRPSRFGQMKSRSAGNVCSAIGHALRISRDLLLVVWAMSALAFCLVVIVAGML